MIRQTPTPTHKHTHLANVLWLKKLTSNQNSPCSLTLMLWLYLLIPGLSSVLYLAQTLVCVRVRACVTEQVLCHPLLSPPLPSFNSPVLLMHTVAKHKFTTFLPLKLPPKHIQTAPSLDNTAGCLLLPGPLIVCHTLSSNTHYTSYNTTNLTSSCLYSSCLQCKNLSWKVLNPNVYMNKS